MNFTFTPPVEPAPLTFGDLKEGEKFYHADQAPESAGERIKIRVIDTNRYLAYEPLGCLAYELEYDFPVRRADGRADPAAPTWRRGVEHVEQGDVFICRGSRTFWIANDSGRFVSLSSGIAVDSDMFDRTEQMVLTGEFVYQPPA